MRHFWIWLSLSTAIFAGCTPIYLGVSLRFERRDVEALISEVRAIGEKFECSVEEMPNGPHTSEWTIHFRMRGKKFVRRDPLALLVIEEKGLLSVDVGRRGGLGQGFRPEEVSMIQAMVSEIQTLRGYVAVEREVGIDINNARKTAEPGATDNPDDAQRLREDH